MSADLTGTLGLGEPYHVGIAVRNIETAMARFDELLGIAPWGRLDAEVPAVYRGQQTVSGVRSAFARVGSMYVELVEPTVGDFPAKTFLQERGEGIYHVGYWVEDMAAALQRAEKAHLSVDWAFPVGDPQVVYLDASATFGMHVEFVHPAMRAGIEDAIARAEHGRPAPAP
ncbi:MAG: VOC family protein [Actinomycetota bacterium]